MTQQQHLSQTLAAAYFQSLAGRSDSITRQYQTSPRFFTTKKEVDQQIIEQAELEAEKRGIQS